MASQSSVIGLLRVLLSANVAEYETAMKRSADVTKKVTAELKDTAAQTTSFGGSLAKSLNIPASVQSSVSGIASSLKVLGAAAAGLKIADLVTDFVSFAGQLSDLSERTEIPIRQLQRLQYAGDLVGVSVEQIASAVSQMQNRLAGGDKGAIQALDQLGLAWERLQALDPGAQFEAIATEIAKIPDPAMRTHLAMELFGRSGATLLPLLKQNLKDVGDEAESLGAVIDERLIRSGDKLGDAWTKLKSISFGLLAEGLRPLLEHFERLPSEINSVSVAIDTLRGKMQALPAVKVSQAVENMFGGTSIDSILKARRMSADEIKAIEADLNKSVQATIKATDAWAESVKKLRDQLSGAKLQSDVKQLQQALNGFTAEQRNTEAAMDRVAEAAQRLFDEHATLTPELYRLIIANGNLAKSMPPVVAGLQEIAQMGRLVNDHFEKTIAIADGLIPKLEVIAGIDLQGVGAIPLPTAPQIQESVNGLNDLIGALQTLSRIGPESIGGIVDAIGQMIQGWQLATDAVKSFQAGGLGMLGKISAGINLISGIIGIGQALAGLGERLFGDRGRDMVEAFAASHGGFDRLHEKLLELGAEGERLWIKLTQGVGRNNPQEAQAAIVLVSEALAKGAQKTAEATKEIDAAAKQLTATLRREFDALTSEIDSLTQSIANEMPEEVMGVVERQTRDRIAAIEAERQKVEEQLRQAGEAVGEEAEEIGRTVDEHVGGALDEVGRDLERSKGQFSDWGRHVGAVMQSLAIGVPIPSPSGGFGLPPPSLPGVGSIGASISGAEVTSPSVVRQLTSTAAAPAGGGALAVHVHTHGPVFAEEEYLKRTVAPAVLSGIREGGASLTAFRDLVSLTGEP